MVYYRGLYHGVVTTEQRVASYTESVHFHRTHNQCPTQSQQIGGPVGFRPPRARGEGGSRGGGDEEGAGETCGES